MMQIQTNEPRQYSNVRLIKHWEHWWGKNASGRRPRRLSTDDAIKEESLRFTEKNAHSVISCIKSELGRQFNQQTVRSTGN